MKTDEGKTPSRKAKKQKEMMRDEIIIYLSSFWEEKSVKRRRGESVDQIYLVKSVPFAGDEFDRCRPGKSEGDGLKRDMELRSEISIRTSHRSGWNEEEEEDVPLFMAGILCVG